MGRRGLSASNGYADGDELRVGGVTRLGLFRSVSMPNQARRTCPHERLPGDGSPYRYHTMTFRCGERACVGNRLLHKLSYVDDESGVGLDATISRVPRRKAQGTKHTKQDIFIPGCHSQLSIQFHRFKLARASLSSPVSPSPLVCLVLRESGSTGSNWIALVTIPTLPQRGFLSSNSPACLTCGDGVLAPANSSTSPL